MTRTMRITGAALALTLALTAMAAEGRIPIWQPITISPGGEGKYILTRDIPSAGIPAIDILPGTVAVDIDLNGFTIYGSVGLNVIQARGVDSLTVRNGTIMFGGGGGGQAGVWATECRKVVIEDMKIEFIQGAGIFLGEVNAFAVRRNVITNCTTMDGIPVDGNWFDPAIPTEGTIEDNVIRECSGGIGVMNGSSVAVLNNRIESSVGGPGIFVETCYACVLQKNTVQEAFGNGLELANFTDGKIHNNVITLCGSEGIWIQGNSNSNLVLDNVAGQNGSNGMLVDGTGNHLERNVLNQNGIAAGLGWGMYLNGFQNTYRGNTAQANLGAPPVCPGFPATTDFCDATGGANTSPLNQPGFLNGDNLMPGLL